MSITYQCNLCGAETGRDKDGRAQRAGMQRVLEIPNTYLYTLKLYISNDDHDRPTSSHQGDEICNECFRKIAAEVLRDWDGKSKPRGRS